MIAKSSDRAKQADIAMEWLKKAVAGGFQEVAVLKKDTDLDLLRDREDFKKLVAGVEKRNETPKPPSDTQTHLENQH